MFQNVQNMRNEFCLNFFEFAVVRFSQETTNLMKIMRERDNVSYIIYCYDENRKLILLMFQASLF